MPPDDPTTLASACTPPPESWPVLTVEELAAMLRIERKTAYAAIRRGEIPGARRIGGVIRISRERVLAWLSQDQGRADRSRSR
jgi:excisionase family DNA binding protein